VPRGPRIPDFGGTACAPPINYRENFATETQVPADSGDQVPDFLLERPTVPTGPNPRPNYQFDAIYADRPYLSSILDATDETIAPTDV